ncbi:MAG: hypothetical protein F6J93_35510 [Oscillatoria sp. SIO1A7]|nr:hypothetical protein [Oscillatoria sp. SIO1A7]
MGNIAVSYQLSAVSSQQKSCNHCNRAFVTVLTLTGSAISDPFNRPKKSQVLRRTGVPPVRRTSKGLFGSLSYGEARERYLFGNPYTLDPTP